MTLTQVDVDDTGNVVWDDLPLYVECVECGTYNLPEDGFCGYCSEDFEEVECCDEGAPGWDGNYCARCA